MSNVASGAGAGGPRDRLKVAFLGGSCRSAVGRAHRTAIDVDRRYQLVAGCFSRDNQVNLESALEYGVEPARTARSLDELLEKEAGVLDAVIVLTPTDQHFPQIRRCLDAGLPVICEKAMVSTVDEARAVVSLLEREPGRFLAVTYNYTGYPMVRELKALIESGAFGEIRQIRAEMPQEGFAKLDAEGRPLTPQGWRLKDGDVPTLSLDLGVHLHSLVKFLTGAMPLSVVATSGTKGNFPGVVDAVSCLARYSAGIDASIWYTKAALGQRNGLKLEVYGTRQSAVWVQEFPEQLAMCDSTGSRVVLDRGSPGVRVASQARYTRFKAGHPSGFIEAFANYYVDIADTFAAFRASGVFQETPYVFGPWTAEEGMRLLQAIARSSGSCQWEEV